jgi:hypothetical protein
MPTYYDRYKLFKNNGEVAPIPSILVKPSSQDKTAVYKLGHTRLDKLSQEYYGNPYHGWLIMAANPRYGGLEWDIPNGEVIRVPFPFKDAIDRYNKEIERHITLYG